MIIPDLIAIYGFFVDVPKLFIHVLTFSTEALGNKNMFLSPFPKLLLAYAYQKPLAIEPDRMKSVLMSHDRLNTYQA